MPLTLHKIVCSGEIWTGGLPCKNSSTIVYYILSRFLYWQDGDPVGKSGLVYIPTVLEALYSTPGWLVVLYCHADSLVL